MEIVVDVADMKVSNEPASVLVAHSLFSCIGISIYDPATRVGGLLHYLLPDSTLDPVKAKRNPCMFADTGIPLLFKSVYKLGGKKQRMKVTMVGGAQIIETQGLFNLGKKNIIAARKFFWRNNILINYQHVGESSSRTFRMSINNGRVWIKIFGEDVIEI